MKPFNQFIIALIGFFLGIAMDLVAAVHNGLLRIDNWLQKAWEENQ